VKVADRQKIVEEKDLLQIIAAPAASPAVAGS